MGVFRRRDRSRPPFRFKIPEGQRLSLLQVAGECNVLLKTSEVSKNKNDT
jgi:hypothetical protein